MSDHHHTLKQKEEIDSQVLPLPISSVPMIIDYALCDKSGKELGSGGSPVLPSKDQSAAATQFPPGD